MAEKLSENFKDWPEEEKVKLITEQLSGIRFGTLTIEVKHGKIFGYEYKGNQKFYNTKPEATGEKPNG